MEEEHIKGKYRKIFYYPHESTTRKYENRTEKRERIKFENKMKKYKESKSNRDSKMTTRDLLLNK